MKKIFVILLFLIVLPAILGLCVTALWNNIVVSVCGFAAIGFWQGVGLFLLGQILTGGFILGIFLVGAGIHTVGHHHKAGFGNHWHDMTDEQRREFISRRREHFGFFYRPQRHDDAAE